MCCLGTATGGVLGAVPSLMFYPDTAPRGCLLLFFPYAGIVSKKRFILSAGVDHKQADELLGGQIERQID